MLISTKAFKLVLAVLIATGVTLCAQPNNAKAAEAVVDTIMAVVNDDIITAQDLNKRMKVVYTQIDNAPISAEEKAQARIHMRGQVLNEMIRETLFQQEIKKAGISVSAQEVNDAINNIKANNNFNDEQLQEALALQGFSYTDYREELTRQILSNKLMNRNVRSKIVVTKADIERYYNEHSAEYLSAREYRVWNLFVRWSEYGSENERNQSMMIINGIYDRLKSGADFMELVGAAGKTYGGGELGYYKLTEIAPDFRTVIEGLGPYSYSDIIYGPGSAQIFYVSEIRVAENQGVEEVSEEITEKIYQQELDKTFEAWLKELHNNSHIEILDPTLRDMIQQIAQ